MLQPDRFLLQCRLCWTAPYTSPPPGFLSLCPSLSGILCLSLHPLLQRHAKAVGSLRRVWGSARAARGCYLGLLQQTGSSSPRGRGRGESQSHAQLSQSGTISAFQLRGKKENSGIGRKRQQRESDSAR